MQRRKSSIYLSKLELGKTLNGRKTKLSYQKVMPENRKLSLFVKRCLKLDESNKVFFKE